MGSSTSQKWKASIAFWGSANPSGCDRSRIVTVSPGPSSPPVQVTWRPYKNSGSCGIVSSVRTTRPSASIAPAHVVPAGPVHHETAVGQEMLRALLRVLADVVEEPEVAAGPETASRPVV